MTERETGVKVRGKNRRSLHDNTLFSSIPAIRVISLVFREMWDTAGLPLKPVTGLTALHGCPMFAPAYVGRKRWATRISYFTELARTADAVSLKGNRMISINATNLDRKSGRSPTTALGSGPYCLFLRIGPKRSRGPAVLPEYPHTLQRRGVRYSSQAEAPRAERVGTW